MTPVILLSSCCTGPFLGSPIVSRSMIFSCTSPDDFSMEHVFWAWGQYVLEKTTTPSWLSAMFLETKAAGSRDIFDLLSVGGNWGTDIQSGQSEGARSEYEATRSEETECPEQLKRAARSAGPWGHRSSTNLRVAAARGPAKAWEARREASIMTSQSSLYLLPME